MWVFTGVTEGPAAPAVRGGADTRGAPAGRPPSVGFFSDEFVPTLNGVRRAP